MVNWGYMQILHYIKIEEILPVRVQKRFYLLPTDKCMPELTKHMMS